MKKPVALIAALFLLAATIAPAAAVIEAEEAFYNTWARTDMPVDSGMVDRTWMWGPAPNTEVLAEPYAEHPIGERPVQYFDKSRMEVNDPNLEYDGLWYVTNGLLVVELYSLIAHTPPLSGQSTSALSFQPTESSRQPPSSSIPNWGRPNAAVWKMWWASRSSTAPR